MAKTRDCDVCGKPFEPRGRQRYHVECAPVQHQKQLAALHEKRKREAEERRPKRCAVCGKELKHTHGSKGGRPPKYCQDNLDCRAKGLAAAVQRQQERRKAANGS